MNIFYLIRHAHADCQPDENRPLSVRGKRDAVKVAEMLSHYPIDAICSSPYRRALQTVEPLVAKLEIPIQITLGLRERKLGHAIVGDLFSAVEVTWVGPTFFHPGGESNAAAQERGVFVINKFQQQYPGAHVVLSTHGNLMALVMQYFDPGIDFYFLAIPDNARCV